MGASDPPTSLLDLEQAATYLATSPRHMRRLVADRRIAFVKIGHFVRFTIEDLESFIGAGRVDPS